MFFIHLIGISVFTGYIILDRLIFRRFLKEGALNPLDFYKKSLPILLFFTIAIIASGALMIYKNQNLLNSDIFIAKITLATLLFVMFFGCGIFIKNFKKPARIAYRFFVLVLLFIVFYLGTIIS